MPLSVVTNDSSCNHLKRFVLNYSCLKLQKTTLPLQQHFYGISLLKLLYLYGKYSVQTTSMIFWSLCAFIWFKNIEKMLLQMTCVFLQLESTTYMYFAKLEHPNL
jgi:hypothetical protein